MTQILSAFRGLDRLVKGIVFEPGYPLLKVIEPVQQGAKGGNEPGAQHPALGNSLHRPKMVADEKSEPEQGGECEGEEQSRTWL
ncbi:MAG TPA: hypothetical protein VFT74_08895, partial [Isosphaeraceae bacterium]|nr:hypothetical protein [Isosphaeraceae bacterium]